MTIIQPNKNKNNFNGLLVFSIFALGIMAVLSIFLYNQNVNLRHSISANVDRLQSLNEVNADYKNKLYSILDSKNMSASIEGADLVQEKIPAYLESRENILASKTGL